jgi:hypothetical protein
MNPDAAPIGGCAWFGVTVKGALQQRSGANEKAA